MEYFTRPENLDGFILIEELATAGINVKEITQEADGTISLDIPSKSSAKAQTVIENHLGKTEWDTPEEISAKLA